MPRCEFCHETVSHQEYRDHVARHVARQPDGQHESHITLPEDLRADVSVLDTEPCVYVHRTCGGHTQMPDDIIRTYVVDPYHYTASTFCCTCGDYFPSRQFSWTETGQTLTAYRRSLLARKGVGYKAVFAVTHPIPLAICGFLISLVFGQNYVMWLLIPALCFLFGIAFGRQVRTSLVQLLRL